MRNGKRRGVMNVGGDCELLSPTPSFGRTTSHSEISRCYLLQKKTGKIDEISFSFTSNNNNDNEDDEENDENEENDQNLKRGNSSILFEQFVLTLEEIEGKTMPISSSDCTALQDLLFQQFLKLKNYRQVTKAIEKLLISTTSLLSAKNSPILNYEFALTFVSTAISHQKISANQNIEKDQIFNSIFQLQRIEKVLKAILTTDIIQSKIPFIYKLRPTDISLKLNLNSFFTDEIIKFFAHYMENEREFFYFIVPSHKAFLLFDFKTGMLKLPVLEKNLRSKSKSKLGNRKITQSPSSNSSSDNNIDNQLENNNNNENTENETNNNIEDNKNDNNNNNEETKVENEIYLFYKNLIERMFVWLALDENYLGSGISSTYYRFLETIDLPLENLTSLFALWFFHLPNNFIEFIPIWSLENEYGSNSNIINPIKTSKSSIQFFIRCVFMLYIKSLKKQSNNNINNNNNNNNNDNNNDSNSNINLNSSNNNIDNNEIEFNIYSKLYEECESTNKIGHALVLSRLVIEEIQLIINSKRYLDQESNLKSNIKNWTLLKSKLTNLLSLSSFIPAANRFELSISSFESTKSIYYFISILQLNSHFNEEKIEENVDAIQKIFPSIFQAKNNIAGAMNVFDFVTAHKVIEVHRYLSLNSFSLLSRNFFFFINH